MLHENNANITEGTYRKRKVSWEHGKEKKKTKADKESIMFKM